MIWGSVNGIDIIVHGMSLGKDGRQVGNKN